MYIVFNSKCERKLIIELGSLISISITRTTNISLFCGALEASSSIAIAAAGQSSDVTSDLNIKGISF